MKHLVVFCLLLLMEAGVLTGQDQAQGTFIRVGSGSQQNQQSNFERSEESNSRTSISIERNLQVIQGAGRDTTPDPWLPMMPPMNNIVSVTTRCDRTRNSMQVSFQFQDPFDGFLYTKGYYNVRGCKVRGNNSPNVNLDLTLSGSCGVLATGTDRDLRYSVTVVVMMEAEWEILQMMDAAFSVHCGFTPDLDITIGNGVTVPMIGVTDLPITIPPLPECRMQIVPGTDPRNQRASELTLGELATMVFYLNMDGPSEEFDIFVYNCITTNGRGSRQIQLLDSSGCPAQQKIIGHVLYSRGRVRERETLAYAHFKVFKFPEVPNVYFECQCRVCLHDCSRPICPGLDQSVYTGASLGFDPNQDPADRNGLHQQAGRRRKRQVALAPPQQPQQSVEQRLANDVGLVVPPGDLSKVQKTVLTITVVPPKTGPDRYTQGENNYVGNGVSRSGGLAEGDSFVGSIPFIIAVAILAALLLISMIIACCLFFRSRRRDKKSESRAYSTYSGYSDVRY